MAAFTFTALSDRAAEQVIVVGSVENTDGENAHSGSLPVGFGDCLILEGQASIDGNATLVAPTLMGARVSLVDAAGTVINPIDVPPIYQTGTVRCAFHFKPDQVVYWKQGELLQVVFPELDSNATPTGDMSIWVTVRRIRQVSMGRVLGDQIVFAT